ncbi:MAG: hypothetical protein H0U66_04970 [Gemmatimonadaceae bacterium]|nr:hypothetical protein [Gemmatimonadaceae bacterium]
MSQRRRVLRFRKRSTGIIHRRERHRIDCGSWLPFPSMRDRYEKRSRNTDCGCIARRWTFGERDGNLGDRQFDTFTTRTSLSNARERAMRKRRRFQLRRVIAQ